MATNVIGSLVVALKVNSAKLVEGYKKAAKRAGDFVKKTRKHLNNAAKGFAGLATAATVALGAMVASTANAATESNRLAKSVGTNIETLTQWSHAAKQVGLEQDKIADIFKDTQDKIGDFIATGGGAAADHFEQLNLNAEELAKLGPDQQLLKIAESMDQLGSRSEKVFFLEAIASDASNLLPLLDNGAAELKRMQNEAVALGVSISQVSAEKMEALTREVERSGSVFQGLQNRITTQFAPVITATVESFNDLAVANNGFSEAVDAGFKGVVYAAGFVLDALNGLHVTYAGLKLGALELASSIASSFSSIPETVAKVLNVVTTPIRMMITGLIDSFKKLADFAASFGGFAGELAGDISQMAESANESINAALTFDVTQVSNGIDALKEQVQTASTEFNELLSQPPPSEGLKQWVQEVEAAANDAANAIANATGSSEDTEEKEDGHKCDKNKKLQCEKSFQDRLLAIKHNGSKKFLALQRAIALKEVIMKQFVALQNAWASAPFPFNLPAVAITALETAANISGIRGARANGGPVGANQTYLVGERGPELFTPSTTGNITQNSELKALNKQEPVNTSVNFNINAVDSAGVEELLINNRALIYALVSEAQAEQGTSF